LVATFTTTGANVNVSGAVQVSGTTPNDFTSPVVYVVTAVDDSTASYTVVVTVTGASDNTLTSFSFAEFPNAQGVINGATNTVAVSLPSGSPVTALTANYTTVAPTVRVGAVNQTNGSTKNDFTTSQTYTVIAADGTPATYVVTVTFASASANAITAFSFAAFPAIQGVIDETTTPKTIVVTLPSGTPVTALTAVFTTLAKTVSIGAAVQTSGSTVNDFTTAQTYTAIAANNTTTATYLVSVIVASASDKTITAFWFAAFPSAPGVISETTTPKTIVVTLPSGTPVTARTAYFTTTAPTVKIGTVVQTSSSTVNDFTTTQPYTVVAADGTTATYQVSIVVGAASTNSITAYSFVGYSAYPGVITEPAHTIAVSLPNGAPVTALTANYTTVAPSVKIGTVIQTSGGAPTNDFTSPVTYRVTAANASFADYVVTVTVPLTVLPGVAGTAGANSTNPTVISSNPSNGDTNVPTSIRGAIHTNLVGTKLVTATFDEAMDPTTVTGAFTLFDNTLGISVPGAVTMNAANTIATFTSTAAALNPSTSYTATVSTAAKSATIPGPSIPMPKAVAWSFTTMGASFANQAASFVGQAPVDLLTAGNFVILAQAAITDANPSLSAITGNVGTSPIAGSAMTITCAEVTGIIYSVDASGPAPCKVTDPTRLTAAISDKDTAYAEAAGRSIPDATGLGAGDISGLTIYPGLYKWSNTVLINTDVTLDAKGDTNAVWIFQIAQELTIASGGTLPSGIKVNLIGGAKAANVFWQVGGLTGATLNSYATFNGNILSTAQVILRTGAVLNGRALAKTQVVLDANTVKQPAP
jgi:hypothetical protein